MEAIAMHPITMYELAKTFQHDRIRDAEKHRLLKGRPKVNHSASTEKIAYGLTITGLVALLIVWWIVV